MLDRRCSIGGSLYGQAEFVPVGGDLQYQENGTLRLGAHHGRAEQYYRYDFPSGNARASVSFRDGRPFHDLDLSEGQATVTHVCGQDLYDGHFTAIDACHWQSVWAVEGPRKDQVIVTLYTRIT